MGVQLVKILNPLLIRQPSNINTTKLDYMPTWNKDDSITSSTVPSIEYVDQTEKEAGINTIECGDC